MSKRVAVIAPNPVNGFGFFAYLEAFFENGVEYKTFAIDKTKNIKTNSGMDLELDGVIGDLAGHEDEYDGLIFACGDAIKEFGKMAGNPEVKQMFEVIKKFDESGKSIGGHCAAGLIFEKAGVTKDKKISLHPYAKAAVQNGIATDNNSMIDKNLYTAKNEDYTLDIIPYFIIKL